MRGRHPRQTSQAVGTAGVQIGPGVVSLATFLNKVGGLSYGKIAAVLKQMAGLRVARSTLCRAVLRRRNLNRSMRSWSKRSAVRRWSTRMRAAGGKEG